MENLIKEALSREGYLLHDRGNNWIAAKKTIQGLSGEICLIIEGKSPTRIITIEKYDEEIEIYMDNGWQVNLYLELLEQQIIKDIKLVGAPVM